MILQSNLLLTELSIIYIESRMQNLPFFVGEWALQHNRPLLPLSRAKSHEEVCCNIKFCIQRYIKCSLGGAGHR